MAEKRPLCQYAGRIEELRTADTLPGSGAPLPLWRTATTAGQSLAGSTWTYLTSGLSSTPNIAETGTWNAATGTWTATEAGTYLVIGGSGTTIGSSTTIAKLVITGLAAAIPNRLVSYPTGSDVEATDVQVARLAVGGTVRLSMYVSLAGTTQVNGVGLRICRLGN